MKATHTLLRGALQDLCERHRDEVRLPYAECDVRDYEELPTPGYLQSLQAFCDQHATVEVYIQYLPDGVMIRRAQS